jgi:soluble lytic murein transglycosylase
VVVPFVVAALTATAAGAAIASMPAAGGAVEITTGVAPAKPGLTLAQLLPFERNKVEPIDMRKAFVEGYEAHKHRDFIATIERMQLASTGFLELGDYALFYLGAAERDSGDTQGAAAAFLRLTETYPQSVLADAAGVDYAWLQLKLGHPEFARPAAERVIGHAGESVSAQSARMILAYTMLAAHDIHGAYREAQTLRERFPAGANDGEARALAYAILRIYPEVANTSSFDYRRAEAAILLREGQPSAALAQIRPALAAQPPFTIRAELVWLEAEASRANAVAAKSALIRYLGLAPAGPHAAPALDGLAHICWHADDTAQARVYFGRIVIGFPASALASRSMFEIGRTYEDDGDLESARTEYQRLVKRYPASEAAAEARFRAPFMLYMQRRYELAVAEFSAARTAAREAGDRDRFAYWQGRALEQNGDQAEAGEIFSRVARSIESNYYPALARMRVDPGPPIFPAAAVPDPARFPDPPPAVAGPAQFHLSRVLMLRQLGLRELEPPELRAIEVQTGDAPELRNFVLAEMAASGAWYDALQMAQRMLNSAQINPLVAERIRYPRAYWELVSAAAGGKGLDPFLVAALIRQESLFNPDARSGSDARGLMQLLPSTAERYAAMAGVAASPLDLYDPNLSVALGTTYLKQLFGMFNGDMFKAVAAYNGGEHAVAGWVAKYPGDDDQWVENIEFQQTRDYVKKVIGGLREYRLLYQPPPPAASNSIPAAPSQE